MTSPFTYDFGYGWPLTWGHAIPLALGAVTAAVALWLQWRRSVVIVSMVLSAWGLTSLLVMHVLFGINAPTTLPSGRFMTSGTGRLLDVGAGSGRAAIGVLLARPQARATAVDVYSGFWGIEDNTPERLMRNARIARVADRVEAQIGDARQLPFPDASYDAVVSTYAIDHLRREEIPVALGEVARVLKPGGEFLLGIVNQDFWVHLTMPIPHFGLAAHRPQDPARWHALLEKAGFEIVEEGTSPATLYWIARKRQSG
jgi:SAM-dependent methyltransferase